ncbi:MAG: uracil-DNA glycosylase [Syntrophomonadaceae bacterium]|nr:uracil-DNA glycosylase [Syntrophomonadaceae bacterium]
MPTEQPGLFGDDFERAVAKTPSPALETPPAIAGPFLPGIKEEDGFTSIKAYQELHNLAADCKRCRLHLTRQQVVFGAGDVHTRILFVGEGPGKDEDLQGLPFVGRAGQLLDKILEAADFSRSQVYITNVVKCRPPGNRLPHPDEVKECRNYLEAQIRIINPCIIVCLGALASQTIIDPKARISQVRGQWFIRKGIKIMATYHPAALLRNESYKRPAWEDFKLIRDEYKRLCCGMD